MPHECYACFIDKLPASVKTELNVRFGKKNLNIEEETVAGFAIAKNLFEVYERKKERAKSSSKKKRELAADETLKSFATAASEIVVQDESKSKNAPEMAEIEESEIAIQDDDCFTDLFCKSEITKLTEDVKYPVDSKAILPLETLPIPKLVRSTSCELFPVHYKKNPHPKNMRTMSEMFM